MSEIDLPHNAAPDADERYEGGLPTDKNWVDFATYTYSHSSEFWSYMDATKHMTEALETIVEKTQDTTFEGFVGQVKELCQQRRAFLKAIDDVPSPGDVWHPSR